MKIIIDAMGGDNAPEEIVKGAVRAKCELGVEGYVESAASGLVAAVELAHRLLGLPPVDFPQETALGALAHYVSNPTVVNFQPMNVNFGIISPLGYRVKGKRNKNAEISKRSLEIIESLKAKEVFHCEDNH